MLSIFFVFSFCDILMCSEIVLPGWQEYYQLLKLVAFYFVSFVFVLKCEFSTIFLPGVAILISLEIDMLCFVIFYCDIFKGV